jgi:catechol 2,3-dioxygenase-like lactoylglutathione lyase family enzyme
MNLNTARVFVRDISEASRFYREKIGLELTAGSVEYGYCVFDAGNTQLVVESVALDAPQEEQILARKVS